MTRVDGRVVRPHDLDIVLEGEEGAHEAMVQRVVYLGFEVRAELLPREGAPLSVQLTRTEAEQLELAEGDIVWARSGRIPVRA